MQVLTFGFLLAIVVLAIWKVILRPKKLGRLPPGPKGKPFVGNITDFPPPGQQEWQHWIKHKEIYGPISSVTAFGTTMVILNDADMAIELLEKRAAVHSSRMVPTFLGEMCGFSDSPVVMQHGPTSRLQRKHIHGLLSGTAVKTFDSTQEAEVRRFLFRVTQSAQDVVEHIRTEAGAIILKMAYGYTIEPHKPDPLVDLGDKAMYGFSDAGTFGAYLVDILPFLKYMPEWLPGTGFKRTARRYKQTLMEATNKPYDFVLRQMEAGTNEPSYVSKYVQQYEGRLGPKEDDIGRWTALGIYLGGADTTVSTLASFFVAMTYFPNVLKQAQEEIDRVIGSSRLPTFKDRPSLPYVEAVVWEALRWHPVAPMGVPHMSTQDDEYNGYFIPKGSILVPNIWNFLHDPTRYPDPLTFNPARFLHQSNPPNPDPRKYSFGFGRRICPGRVLADSSVWLTIAQSLASLDIRHPDSIKDDKNPITFDEKLHFDPNFFTPGLLSHPKEVRAVIRPRNEGYKELIESVEVEFPWGKSDSEALMGDGRKAEGEKK